jgi:hypothetical protein
MLDNEDELEKIKDECEKLAADLKAITSLPSNKVADDRISKLSAEVSTKLHFKF